MMFEQRRNERYEFSGDKVEYTLKPFSESEICEAGVVNFSETGLCLLSSNRLSAGEEITIRNFMTSSFRTAVVIWVEQYDDIFYLHKSDEVLFKIGLLFN
jgi:hypothetical protein